MSACISPTIPGGSTCWNGARPRRTRCRSISTGSSCPIAPAAACCCRSSARPTVRRWNSGEIELRYDAARGQLLRLVLRASAADRARALQRDPARPSSRKREPRTARAGKCILALASRHRGLRHPNRKEAPAFKAELKSIPGGAEIIARGLSTPIAPGPDRPAQTLALHHLLERQHYRLGHWRLASSDINYRRFFDVNTLAGVAGRGCRHLRGHPPPGQAADRRRTGCRACGSITSTACAIPRNISSACAAWSGTRKAAAQSRSTW